MKYGKLILLVFCVALMYRCGEAPPPSSAELPTGWRVATDRAAYLSSYTKYVNQHEGLSLPLSEVLEGDAGQVVFRGIVVGERSRKAAKLLLANGDCVPYPTTAFTGLSCLNSDSVRVDLLLYDLNQTASFLLARIDSSETASPAFGPLYELAAAAE